MKWIAALCLFSLASCMSAPASLVGPAAGVAPAPAPDRQIAIALGQRQLDSKDWSPVEDQPAFGLEYSEQSDPDGVGWEIGFAGSSKDGNVGGFDVTGSTAELYGGLHKEFGNDRVRPYVGGGLSLIKARVEVSGAGDEDDASAAAYLHGGVQFLVSPTVFLGVDARVLFGSDITIAGVNGDADYSQLALVLGWRF